MVLAECLNILQHQIYLLEVLVDNVLQAAVWSVTSLSLVCKWLVELAGVVIRLLQNVPEPINTAMVQLFDWLVLSQNSSYDTRLD